MIFFKDHGEGGYIGKSMSVRATKAYNNGEKPLSKWTKKEIVGIVEDMEFDNFSMDLFKKLNLNTLRNFMLEHSSWHHTGALFNETDFYNLDVSYLEALTDEKILELLELAKSQKKPSLTTEEKAIKKAEKEVRVRAKEVKADREKLFKYQTKYKTLKGFLKGNLNFEELSRTRQEKINSKREQLKDIWSKQLSSDAWQWKKINDDDFIDSYIK